MLLQGMGKIYDMKRIDFLKIARSLAQTAACMGLTVAGVLGAEQESLPHHFIRFEDDEGYQVGDFKGPKDGIQLLQGAARIVRDDGGEAGQCLETVAGEHYASIHFHGERVSQYDMTYYEVWVKPSASPTEKGEEFMDFDGAMLGFFSDGVDGRGTFHAYHALPEQEGYWVSTGVSADTDISGMTEEWIRIGISQNLAKETWNLEIGGVKVLEEIRYTEAPSVDGIRLWFLGHVTRANRFDDLWVSPVEPDSLHLGKARDSSPAWSGKKDRAEKLNRSGERKVGRKQYDKDRRRHDADIPDGDVKASPKMLEFDFDILKGGKQHGKFDDDKSDQKRSYLIYSPEYDDDGNPLPLKVKIQCDSELAEGIDLSQIVWVVTEMGKPEERSRKVIVHGNFQSGFTQIAVIPSEWANKGTEIRVGTDIEIAKPQQKVETP